MRMLKALSILAAVIGVLTFGCSKDASSSEPPGASQGSEAPPASATGTVPATRLTDGQIANIVVTIDSGEIEQAQLALHRTSDASVRAFATQMVEEHTKTKQTGALLATDSTIGLAVSPKSTELQAQSQQMIARLNAADGSNFDKTYIDGEIEQHAEVLKMLDDQLIPAATLVALRNYLNDGRRMAQRHFDHARQLQK